MKICLINNLYGTAGGSARVVQNTARGLMRAGHQVVVICVGEKNNIQEIDGVLVYELKQPNIFSFTKLGKHGVILRLVWWFFNFFNLSVVFKIRSILKKEKVEVVHLHNAVGLSALLPYFLKKYKLVQTVHDLQLIYPSGQLIYGHQKDFENVVFARKLYEFLNRFLNKNTRKVIFPSKWLLNFYEQHNFFIKSEKKVVANGIDLANVINVSQTGHKAQNFLYVGNLDEYKGVKFLLKVFKEFATGKAIKLHMVGGGQDLSGLKQNFEKENIVFYGQLERKEVGEMYEKSDVLIMPSLTYENLPTVIIEAFNYGLPVIASRIGGIVEMVEQNETGWLFEPGNKQELVDILQKLESGEIDLGAMQKNCLAAVVKYDLEKYINEIVEIYKGSF